jgi:ATP-dependent protease ClpP protease subunit
MPKNTTFDIDGYIGSGSYSRQYVKAMLKDTGTNPVLVNICSLGGALDHGLGIHDQFVDHGNITARLSGFVASSATVAACGCSTIKMNSTAFFLVHKVMGWVDEWGYMNEDDLQALIDKLTQDKDENKKMDVVIANIYAKRTGKPINKLVELMKKNTWLTAEEAKEWGFVDEIIEMTGKKNALEDPQKVAMIAAAGLPIPERKNQPETLAQKADDLNAALSNFKNEIINGVKKLLPGQKQNSNHSNSNNMSKTQKLAALIAVMAVANIEVDEENGAYINADQLDKINDALSKAADAENKMKTAQQERNTIIAALDDIDKTVADAEGHTAKVNAIKLKLASKAGTSPTGNNGGDGGKNNADGVDWDAINALPHNQAADDDLI